MLFSHSGVLGATKTCILPNCPGKLPLAHKFALGYQHIVSKSWRLRQYIICLINGKERGLSHQRMLELSRKIMNLIDNIPEWDSPDAMLPCSLLQLEFYQILMIFHRFNVDETSTRLSQYSYSNTTHVGAAKAIIDIHQGLLTKGYRVLMSLRQDLLNAALSICYDFVNSQPIAGNRTRSIRSQFCIDMSQVTSRCWACPWQNATTCNC